MHPLDNEMVISWPSAAGRTYSVWSTDDLLSWGDIPVQSGIVATPPTNTLTIETNPADTAKFFRVEVD
jgi:hypothetical protein